MERWTLELNFRSNFGESHTMALDLEPNVARNVVYIEPPMPVELSGFTTFTDIVHVLKMKKLRKDLFVAEATRLGHLLAERMEDKEGWHGESRMEALRKQKP